MVDGSARRTYNPSAQLPPTSLRAQPEAAPPTSTTPVPSCPGGGLLRPLRADDTHRQPGERDQPNPEPRTPNHPAGGHHLLVDLWVADPAPLRRVKTWRTLLPDACREAGATVLGARFHQFQPEGVTGIVLLAESHASVHTWPEAGLVTLDVFTCGALDARAIVDRIRQSLAPVRERVTEVARGDRAFPPDSTAH